VNPVIAIDDSRQVLVVVGPEAAPPALVAAVRAAVGIFGRALVVATSPASVLRRWTSDRDGAEAAARDRLLPLLRELRSEGIEAEGVVGDDDPALAAADALAVFHADEVIFVGCPTGGAVRVLEERYDGPIAVLDGERRAA
jgi:hypothetical protein